VESLLHPAGDCSRCLRRAIQERADVVDAWAADTRAAEDHVIAEAMAPEIRVITHTKGIQCRKKALNVQSACSIDTIEDVHFPVPRVDCVLERTVGPAKLPEDTVGNRRICEKKTTEPLDLLRQEKDIVIHNEDKPCTLFASDLPPPGGGARCRSRTEIHRRIVQRELRAQIYGWIVVGNNNLSHRGRPKSAPREELHVPRAAETGKDDRHFASTCTARSMGDRTNVGREACHPSDVLRPGAIGIPYTNPA
jgi:hypothetical protein